MKVKFDIDVKVLMLAVFIFGAAAGCLVSSLAARPVQADTNDAYRIVSALNDLKYELRESNKNFSRIDWAIRHLNK